MIATARAADLLAGFPAALRAAGLAVDPARAADFLRATAVCRLDGLADLARIGRVTLTRSHQDFPAFDAAFAAWFGDAPVAAPAVPDQGGGSPAPRPPLGRDRPARSRRWCRGGPGGCRRRVAQPQGLPPARL